MGGCVHFHSAKLESYRRNRTLSRCLSVILVNARRRQKHEQEGGRVALSDGLPSFPNGRKQGMGLALSGSPDDLKPSVAFRGNGNSQKSRTRRRSGSVTRHTLDRAVGCASCFGTLGNGKRWVTVTMDGNILSKERLGRRPSSLSLLFPFREKIRLEKKNCRVRPLLFLLSSFW